MMDKHIGIKLVYVLAMVCWLAFLYAVARLGR